MPPIRALLFTTLLATCAFGAERKEDHPLIPTMKKAKRCLQHMDGEIKDYTCTLVKRERIDGRLSKHAFAFVKLRHQDARDGVAATPFSVYMRFSDPSDIRGREVLFVDGRHKGKLIARNGGSNFGYVTVAISPLSELAMVDNHYPVTEMGIRNLVERLLEIGEEELQHDEIEVKYYRGAKINDRVCTAIEVTHPVRRSHFRYHIARIFIDDELQLPIRYASYDWPEKKGGTPRLIEEYTYLDLNFNVGLTDSDFDYKNDEYKFEDDVEI
jgi:hypothetical protein